MKPTTPALASLVAGLFVACGGVQVITGLEVSDVTCPSSCENLFGKLEKGVQEVTLQLRGGARRLCLENRYYIQSSRVYSLEFIPEATAIGNTARSFICTCCVRSTVCLNVSGGNQNLNSSPKNEPHQN